MRIIRHMLILLCTCLTALPAHAQENPDLKGTSCVPVRTVSEDELAFRAGERMDFILHYRLGAMNADVGTATVGLDSLTFNGQKAFRCTVSGRTTKFFDVFFKVREYFESVFTREGLRPLKFVRDTHEGGYEARNTYLYMWDAPQPYIAADVYTSKMGHKPMELPLTQCTYDLPALFFFARNMDVDNVEPGRKYPMTFAIDDEVLNVHFILYGRETIKVKGLGKVKTIKFAARLVAGEVFKGEEDMMIWVTDDDNRLPVYFEAPLLVGAAAGRMSGYEGLKYPFTSMVEKAEK